MNHVNLINHIIEAALYIQTFSALSFVVEYQRYTKGSWRRRAVGWHLMSMTFVDGLFAGQLLVSELWPWLGRHEWFVWTIVANFILMGLVTLSRLVILETAQRRGLGPEADRRRSTSSLSPADQPSECAPTPPE